MKRFMVFPIKTKRNLKLLFFSAFIIFLAVSCGTKRQSYSSDAVYGAPRRLPIPVLETKLRNFLDLSLAKLKQEQTIFRSFHQLYFDLSQYQNYLSSVELERMEGRPLHSLYSNLRKLTKPSPYDVPSSLTEQLQEISNTAQIAQTVELKQEEFLVHFIKLLELGAHYKSTRPFIQSQNLMASVQAYLPILEVYEQYIAEHQVPKWFHENVAAMHQSFLRDHFYIFYSTEKTLEEKHFIIPNLILLYNKSYQVHKKIPPQTPKDLQKLETSYDLSFLRHRRDALAMYIVLAEEIEDRWR